MYTSNYDRDTMQYIIMLNGVQVCETSSRAQAYDYVRLMNQGV